MNRKLTLLIGLIFTITIAKAQCETLEEENAALKAQLGINTVNPEAEVKSFNDAFEFSVISCEGARDNQTVTIKFLITHSQVHKNVSLDDFKSKTYDISGVEYQGKSGKLGVDNASAYSKTKIPTDTPFQGSITFKNILPSVEMLKFTSIQFYQKNYDGGGNSSKGSAEIKNLKIEWH